MCIIFFGPCPLLNLIFPDIQFLVSLMNFEQFSAIITSNICFCSLISPFTSLMTHMYILLTSLENFLFCFLLFFLFAFHTFKLTDFYFPLTFSNILVGSSKAFFIPMTVFY